MTNITRSSCRISLQFGQDCMYTLMVLCKEEALKLRGEAQHMRRRSAAVSHYANPTLPPHGSTMLFCMLEGSRQAEERPGQKEKRGSKGTHRCQCQLQLQHQMQARCQCGCHSLILCQCRYRSLILFRWCCSHQPVPSLYSNPKMASVITCILCMQHSQSLGVFL